MEFAFPGFDRIVVNPEICTGKPRIKGTRIPVSSVLAYLAGGMTTKEFLIEFPWVTEEDVLQVLAFCSTMMSDEFLPLEKAA